MLFYFEGKMHTCSNFGADFFVLFLGTFIESNWIFMTLTSAGLSNGLDLKNNSENKLSILFF